METTLSWCIGLLSVSIAIYIHARGIRLIRLGQGKATPVIPWIVAGLFLTHLLEIALFGLALYIEAEILQMGTLEGSHESALHSYLYFSIATYTSLGLGDIFPTGSLRLLTGLEALTGLLMIGWSASFLYVEMRAVEDTANQDRV